jgi:hypothetical protein
MTTDQGYDGIRGVAGTSGLDGGTSTKTRTRDQLSKLSTIWIESVTVLAVHPKHNQHQWQRTPKSHKSVHRGPAIRHRIACRRRRKKWRCSGKCWVPKKIRNEVAANFTQQSNDKQNVECILNVKFGLGSFEGSQLDSKGYPNCVHCTILTIVATLLTEI